MKGAPAGNLIAVQILRCVAALLVVVWHSQLSIKLFTFTYWPEGDPAFRAAHFPSWANHLSAGVDIFFCISGFIMAMLAARASSANADTFILNRFARIFPPYWFFTAVVVAVYLISPRFNVGHFTGNWQEDAVRTVMSLLLIPQADVPILNVGWTLVHEFLFYYLIAALILIRQGQRIASIMAAIAALSIALYAADVKLVYGYGLSPYYMEFFAGALAFRIYRRTSLHYPEAQCAIAVALYFGVSHLLDIYQDPAPQMLIQVSGFGLMGFLLLSGMLGVDAKYDLIKHTLPRILARCGDASYSLYLSHWFVLSLIGKFAGFVRDAPAYAIAAWQVSAIATAVVFAVLFAERIELPLHRRLSDYLKFSVSKNAPA